MTFRAAPMELVLQTVTKSYAGFTAVSALSLSIEPGEIVAFLGPSGCGKTTTLRMVAGLLSPTSGDIVLGGQRVTALPAHRRNIGMLFQNYALFPHMTVAENVAFGLDMRGVRGAAKAARVEAVLQLVQLGPLANRYPRALSGGQQQRVALARALVIEPSILLLDEPLGALDKSLRQNMQVELRQLQRRLGITTVIVTHDQEEALTLSDRIVIMNNGRIEQFDTPEAVYARPSSRFVASFVGVSNFLEARVTGTGPGRTFFETDGGVKAVAVGVAASKRATLLVRPESLGIARSADMPGDQPNTAACVVEQRVFRGNSIDLHLRLGDGTPFVAHQAPQHAGLDVKEGDQVVAFWSEAHVHVIDAPPASQGGAE